MITPDAPVIKVVLQSYLSFSMSVGKRFHGIKRSFVLLE